jgi:hypothetical protein
LFTTQGPGGAFVPLIFITPGTLPFEKMLVTTLAVAARHDPKLESPPCVTPVPQPELEIPPDPTCTVMLAPGVTAHSRLPKPPPAPPAPPLPLPEPNPGPPPAHNSTATQFTLLGTVQLVVHADEAHDQAVMVSPATRLEPSKTNACPKLVPPPPPPLGSCGPHDDPPHVSTCPDVGVVEDTVFP